MEKSESFYCIRCNALHGSDLEAISFRTGFFRISYPLGICRSCRMILMLPDDLSDEVSRHMFTPKRNDIMKPLFIS